MSQKPEIEKAVYNVYEVAALIYSHRKAHCCAERGFS